jgi:hypothetical protein
VKPISSLGVRSPCYSASQNPTFFPKVFIIMICIISFIKDRELICHATIKCGKNRPNHFNFFIA